MRARAAILCLVIALPGLAACSGYGRPDQASSQLSFGVDMARRGLWKEALFRFEEAAKLDPENPRIQSNLGVAYEAAGQFDKALEYYQKALRLAPNDKEIRTNYTRFAEFYQGFKGEKKAGTPGSASGPAAAGTRRSPGAAPLPQTPPEAPAPSPLGTPEPSTPEDTPPPPADN